MTTPFKNWNPFDWSHPDKKRIYFFSEGTAEDKNLLGNKGANLCEMFRLGLPVPPGFIITTETCVDFFNNNNNKNNKLSQNSKLSQTLINQYTKAVHELEKQSGKTFGGIQIGKTGMINKMEQITTIPLLLSVRSGAAVSMPGMMDTILNLGMNEELVQIMARLSNNARWAYDCYRRFIQMFGTVVYNIDKKKYDDILDNIKTKRNVCCDSLLTVSDLQIVIQEFKQLAEIPIDPWEQLQLAIEAVFNSWFSPRAVKYRDIHNIAEDLGTAVTVQSMVYGNMNIRSGSGVAFTRNPGTGDKVFFGEYLNNAEGEDVVAGVRTPVSVDELRGEQPKVYEQLTHIQSLLERHYRDMQDIEFTVENAVLFILQTRRGKRTAMASVKIAVDMVDEKLITERDALMRIDAYQMDFFLHPMLDPSAQMTEKFLIGKGLAASAGAAIGRVALTCEKAQEYNNNNTNCILVRQETSADDITGLHAAIGVLTIHGGVTSHAAVVMRGMGKSAVTGARNMYIKDGILVGEDLNGKAVQISEGTTITIDGSTGNVYLGEMPTVISGKNEHYQRILKWADKYKRIQVLVNAETVDDIRKSQEYGAEGVGLCRTEHMFFHPERLFLFRLMILSDSYEQRCRYLADMLPLQQEDFRQIFRLMPNRQVTVRLLDPPLHEFLPVRQKDDSMAFDHEEDLLKIASELGITLELLLSRIQAMKESNPMMGFRGCRLSIVYPEITEMQTKAIIGAALDVMREGVVVRPEIMIPLVCSDHEVNEIVPIIHKAHDEVCARYASVYGDPGFHVNYSIGCMVEVPRACIRADRIAGCRDVKFVSIGSNDLTQLVFGFSRDDTQRFMGNYVDRHIVSRDPFQSIDVRGVGSLINLAVSKCKKMDPLIKIGICGEHGGDPLSIHFFNKIGVDYVSCSPCRIPIAKLAAAQAHIEDVTKLYSHMDYHPTHMKLA